MTFCPQSPELPWLHPCDAALAAVKPTGEWQLLEIDAQADRLTVHLNGALVTQASNIVNPRGYIGIQGEAGALEYKTIAIRET